MGQSQVLLYLSSDFQKSAVAEVQELMGSGVSEYNIDRFIAFLEHRIEELCGDFVELMGNMGPSGWSFLSKFLFLLHLSSSHWTQTSLSPSLRPLLASMPLLPRSGSTSWYVAPLGRVCCPLLSLTCDFGQPPDIKEDQEPQERKDIIALPAVSPREPSM